MPISKDNTRTNITFNIEFKKKLEAIAKQESRSFNNLVITMLEECLTKREIK